ncbi:hypothetical protein PN296_06160 [Peptostreptococcus anaerobius]|nr:MULTISPECIES: hypothetical protein [Peptostreptococcus]MDB8821803.1 hypothetical protein [Peptostreptococcus anaerobius]MDB8826432.1 hypothetical protein [Peptostreptococcus anaerobius]MDB8828268.1 hypothetical protein [Peptostreptococcus anaerobius]MDB8830014.1 hypothetical protein [Peptostreptococcus anaerobius]MDB8831909.1 hypothetical protein [Peptostreptococcus anaerobius]
MGRRKIEPMNPVKKNIVSESIKTYDTKTMKIQKNLAMCYNG